MQKEKLKIKRILPAFLILNFALLIAGCEIPNLESAECTQSREAARKFYSFHFANEMRPSAEELKKRESFLTANYYRRLADGLTATGPGSTDYFTGAEDPPRTFKIGECRARSATEIDLQIQLYWRDDQSTVQKEAVARMNKQGDAWLVDDVAVNY